MFTGIVTHMTEVSARHDKSGGLIMTVKKPVDWTDLVLGESIATNGACLTVSEIRSDSYDYYLMPETLAKTAFGTKVPERVNLERSLSAKDRFGGHFVQGHVDDVGVVAKIDQRDGYTISVKFPASFTELVIYKGSITINGVSLTVANVQDTVLTVALIPHTLEHTTLGSLKPKDKVNLEFDMLGKYVAKIMSARQA